MSNRHENILLSVMMHRPHSHQSVGHDLMPNIFLSGPPTQSIATYHHSDETLNHLQKYFEVWLNPFISHLKYHVLKFPFFFSPLINIKTTYLDTLYNSLKMSIILKHGGQTRTITSCFLLNFTIDERSMLQQKLEVKIMYFSQI